MWIFAVYELLRTWREQAKDVIKWAKNGGLELKIQSLEKKLPYWHYGQELRASQLRKVVDNPGIVETIEADLRLAHIFFANLEHIRVSMAKHQVSGKAKSIAFAPGYGRINQWCGSLEYQLESGQVIFGSISRRDIAEAIRTFSDRSRTPTADDVADFENSRKAVATMPLDFSTDDQDFSEASLIGIVGCKQFLVVRAGRSTSPPHRLMVKSSTRASCSLTWVKASAKPERTPNIKREGSHQALRQ